MSAPRSLPLNCLTTSLAGPRLVTPSSRKYLQKFILDDGFDVTRESGVGRVTATWTEWLTIPGRLGNLYETRSVGRGRGGGCDN